MPIRVPHSSQISFFFLQDMLHLSQNIEMMHNIVAIVMKSCHDVKIIWNHVGVSAERPIPNVARRNILAPAVKMPMIPVKNPPEDISVPGSNPAVPVKSPDVVLAVNGLPINVGVSNRKNTSQ
jgi:hypothetical protein